ncbi:hypothetical protein AMECASPLE_031899 [Ameca splendens]|uniref:Uncharacterized protein n=1 Tax=Ameca splendens TaxID=208324 RepID=A0ABV0Z5I1_9TELE
MKLCLEHSGLDDKGGKRKHADVAEQCQIRNWSNMKETQLCQQRSRIKNALQSVSEVRDRHLTDVGSQVIKQTQNRDILGLQSPDSGCCVSCLEYLYKVICEAVLQCCRIVTI